MAILKYDLKHFKKMQSIQDKCIAILNKIEAIGKKLILVIFSISNQYKKFVFDDRVETLTKGYQKKHKNLLYKMMRYLSFPWHWFIILSWRYLIKKTERLLIDEEGVQVFSGPTGGGKTSVMYEGIERDRKVNHKLWMINTPFEKPRTDIKKEIKYLYHTLFNFEDFWSDGKMHKLPDHRKYGGMVIDEIHRILDYRAFQTREYKSKFVPFINYCVVVRHYIKKIWISTQMDRVDKQIMQLAKYFHMMRINIGFDYQDWMVESGAFKFKILGWYFDSYRVDATGSDYVKNLYKSWYLKSKYADFDYYDTYSMSGAYDHLDFAN